MVSFVADVDVVLSMQQKIFVQREKNVRRLSLQLILPVTTNGFIGYGVVIVSVMAEHAQHFDFRGEMDSARGVSNFVIVGTYSFRSNKLTRVGISKEIDCR